MLLGFVLLGAGLLMAGPAPTEFRKQVEQPYDIETHLLMLWQLRRDCDKADYQGFQADATRLAQLTGTVVTTRLNADGTVAVSVEKVMGRKSLVVENGSVHQTERFGTVAQVCSLLQ